MKLTSLRSAAILLLIVSTSCGSSSAHSGTCASDDGNCYASKLRITENGNALTATPISTPCNAVMNVGSPVTTTNVTTPVPEATGGTIASGHYVLSAREIHLGAAAAPAPVTRTETVFVSNNGATWERSGFEAGKLIDRTNRLVSMNGSAMAFDERCPVFSTFSVSYSANAAEKSFQTFAKNADGSTTEDKYTIASAPPDKAKLPAIVNQPPPIAISGGKSAALDLAWTSSYGCRPIFCYGLLVKRDGLTRGVQSQTSLCVDGGAHDGQTSGNFKIDVAYDAVPEGTPQSIALNVFPVATPDCAANGIALLASGDPRPLIGDAIAIDQTISK